MTTPKKLAECTCCAPGTRWQNALTRRACGLMVAFLGFAFPACDDDPQRVRTIVQTNQHYAVRVEFREEGGVAKIDFASLLIDSTLALQAKDVQVREWRDGCYVIDVEFVR